MKNNKKQVLQEIDGLATPSRHTIDRTSSLWKSYDSRNYRLPCRVIVLTTVEEDSSVYQYKTVFYHFSASLYWSVMFHVVYSFEYFVYRGSSL